MRWFTFHRRHGPTFKQYHGHHKNISLSRHLAVNGFRLIALINVYDDDDDDDDDDDNNNVCISGHFEQIKLID